MPATLTALRWLACAAALALPACGGGDGSPGDGPSSGGVTGGVSTAGYAMTNLVSDTAAPSPYVGTHADTPLVNAWGVAFNPQAFVWVANQGTSSSTLYDGNGVPQSLVVAIPSGSAGLSHPTGIVFNPQSDFTVTQNGVTGASVFIFAGQGGTISGWSPAVNPNNAVTVVDDGASGVVYTGLAIGTSPGGHVLYAADFHQGTVVQLGANFARTGAVGAFQDPTLPAGYSPYGIQAIGGRIYVAYARQDAQATSAVAGAGQGLVDVFDASGNMIQRLIPPGGQLNAPWGMALAPADFGPFSNALLVANAGDGRINAFNPTTGAWMGALSTANGTPIAIDGLHGIAFGNGLNSQPTNTLFFAAGPAGGTHGAYGRIDAKP